MTATLPVGALKRLLRRDPATCEVCGAGLAAAHGHVADTSLRGLRCACETCVVALERTGDTPSVLRTVPGVVRALDEETAEAVWRRLGSPVGVVFAITADDGLVSTFYPGGGGAMESTLDGEDGVDSADALGLPVDLRPEPEIQAVLVDRRPGRTPRGWIVGVDRCYALSARLRGAWQGVDGGAEAEAVLHEFHRDCELVAARSGPAGGAP